ncbi:microtubule associated protein-domain-containing protein [Pilobolus umbonatus]|nr:microtubule associated protein-domain-containing protein [Pilobolus umbonatus]
MTSLLSIEDIIIELKTQLITLTSIHDDIGSSSEEKESDQVELFRSIIALIQNHITGAINKKEDIKNTVNEIHKSILFYKKLMGEFVSNTVELDPSKTLITNLYELQQEEDNVKKRYNDRLTQVKDIDVSTLAINALEEEIQRCEEEYNKRREQVKAGVRQLYSLFVLLGLDLSNYLDLLVDRYYRESDENNKAELCNVLMTEDNMRYITNRIKELEEVRQQVEFRKEEISQNLKHLWGRLHIDIQHCEYFLMSNRGITQKEMNNYEDELRRLMILKQEKVGDFISSAREEIRSLWDKLYYSEDQRHHFTAGETDDLTEAVLEAHEAELSRLQLEYEDSKYILESIDKHMQLKREVEEFEASTRDPNRLFGKGRQRDPGRLLREEKFRKRISRELPKIIKELEGSLLEFEAMKGHPFMVNGESYYAKLFDESNAEESDKPPVDNTPTTPKRQIQVREPFSSPRRKTPIRHVFHTPQANRTRSVLMHDKEDIDEESILHKVRERNIQKRALKRGTSITDVIQNDISHTFDPIRYNDKVKKKRINKR